MRKSLLLSASLVMLFAAIPAERAAATPPADVAITVVTPFGDGSAPFVASGAAVDNGVMCSTGSVEDVYAKVAGWQSDQGFNLQILKRFECDDGSGEFFVKLQVRVGPDGASFNWNVVDGTVAYADLHGTGRGTGLPLCGDDCILDLYEGGMHVD